MGEGSVGEGRLGEQGGGEGGGGEEGDGGGPPIGPLDLSKTSGMIWTKSVICFVTKGIGFLSSLVYLFT